MTLGLCACALRRNTTHDRGSTPMQNVNQQPAEPFDYSTGHELDVHSIFYTIQGEGPFTGHPSVFVRLAGCNLQCPLCDTEYTQGRTRRTVASIVAEVRQKRANARLVVITGGEPTRQVLDYFIDAVLGLDVDITVQIESNGVIAPSDSMIRHISRGHVVYIVSPKTRAIAPETRFARAFKYVISADSVDPSDGLPLRALGHKASPRIARPPDHYIGRIYVNPADAYDAELNRANLLAARDASLKYGYIMGIQLHKLIDIP